MIRLLAQAVGAHPCSRPVFIRAQRGRHKALPLQIILFLLLLGIGTVDAAEPLSRDGLQPTRIQFDANIVNVSDTIAGFPDVAYFMITIPEGEQLASIMITSDENSDGGYWFAVMSGEQFTENSTESSQINTDNILGHVVIRGLDNNFLPTMGNSGIGFDEVLPVGDYAFRIQNWGSGGTFTLELMTAIPSAVHLHTVTSHTDQPIIILLLTLLIATMFASLGSQGSTPALGKSRLKPANFSCFKRSMGIDPHAKTVQNLRPQK